MDPVTIGALVVALASMMWTIYNDLGSPKKGPEPDVVARQVRIALRGGNARPQPNAAAITSIVVEEISKQHEEETLEQRIDRLSKSFQESARLIEQVSAELEARSLTARRLKEEAASAEALARLHKDQAEAVRRMMRAEMHDEMRVELSQGLERVNRRNFRDGIKISIASFVAGGILSILITLFIH